MSDSLTLAIGLFSLFGAIFIGAFAVIDQVAGRQRTARAIRNIGNLDSVTAATLREQQLAVPLMQRVVQPALRRLANFGQRITPVGVMNRLSETLIHAGITSIDGPRLLAIKIVTTGTGWIVGTTFLPLLDTLFPPQGGAAGSTPAQAIIAGIVLGIVGYYIPEWIVRSKASARSLDIQRALPDALDLLSISVTAGLAFESAMDRVSREMRGELGVELYRVVQEMRLGQSRSDALRGLGERTNVPELDSFVLAMVQAEAFGVPIANVLKGQASELRVKRRQRAEEMAQKIPVKILFPLIACIFPVLFIVILGPPGIQIYNNILSQ